MLARLLHGRSLGPEADAAVLTALLHRAVAEALAAIGGHGDAEQQRELRRQSGWAPDPRERGAGQLLSSALAQAELKDGAAAAAAAAGATGGGDAPPPQQGERDPEETEEREVLRLRRENLQLTQRVAALELQQATATATATGVATRADTVTGVGAAAGWLQGDSDDPGQPAFWAQRAQARLLLGPGSGVSLSLARRLA